MLQTKRLAKKENKGTVGSPPGRTSKKGQHTAKRRVNMSLVERAIMLKSGKEQSRADGGEVTRLALTGEDQTRGRDSS